MKVWPEPILDKTAFERVFPEPLEIRWLRDYADGRRRFRTLRKFYQVHADGTVDEIDAGFESDGASIPRFLWRIESPYGPLLELAIPHDHRYVNKIGTRKQADLYFREGFPVVDVAAWKRPFIYNGIRMLGANGWGR